MTADLVGLADCPLCGGEAFMETVAAHQHTIARFMPDYPGGAIAQCLKCSLAIMREGPDAVAEVTAAWNTRAELRALAGAEVGGWISVKDCFPPDGDMVLCYESRKGNMFVSQFCDNLSGDGRPGFVEEFYDKAPTTDGCKGGWGHWPLVTHWQPLPPPPGSGRGGVNNSTNDEENKNG